MFFFQKRSSPITSMMNYAAIIIGSNFLFLGAACYPRFPSEDFDQPVTYKDKEGESKELEDARSEKATVMFRGNRRAGFPMALKVYPADLREYAVREIEVLAELKREGVPHVADFNAAYENDKNEIVVVTGMAGTTDLRKNLVANIGKPDHRYTEAEVCIMMRDLFTTLAKMAECCGIIHGNIMPENLVVSSDEQITLVDFKYASHWQSRTETHNKFEGTPWFMAPEKNEEKDARLESDVYSAAVALYALITDDHKGPFYHACTEACPPEHNRKLAVLQKMKDWCESPVYKTKMSAEVRDLLFHMLKCDPDDRITAHNALKHRWFIKFCPRRRTASKKRVASSSRPMDTPNPMFLFYQFPPHMVYQGYPPPPPVATAGPSSHHASSSQPLYAPFQMYAPHPAYYPPPPPSTARGASRHSSKKRVASSSQPMDTPNPMFPFYQFPPHTVYHGYPPPPPVATAGPSSHHASSSQPLYAPFQMYAPHPAYYPPLPTTATAGIPHPYAPHPTSQPINPHAQHTGTGVPDHASAGQQMYTFPPPPPPPPQTATAGAYPFYPPPTADDAPHPMYASFPTSAGAQHTGTGVAAQPTYAYPPPLQAAPGTPIHVATAQDPPTPATSRSTSGNAETSARGRTSGNRKRASSPSADEQSTSKKKHRAL